MSPKTGHWERAWFFLLIVCEYVFCVLLHLCFAARNLESIWSQRGRLVLGFCLWLPVWVNLSLDWTGIKRCWRNSSGTWRLARIHPSHYLSPVQITNRIVMQDTGNNNLCNIFPFCLCLRTNTLTDLISMIAWWPLKALEWVAKTHTHVLVTLLVANMKCVLLTFLIYCQIFLFHSPFLISTKHNSVLLEHQKHKLQVPTCVCETE